MNSVSEVSNLRKIPWGWLLIIVLVFAVAYGACFLLGNNARESCFWAITVNGIAAFGGILPIIYATFLRPSVPTYYILASSVIRLVLAITGSGIILVFVKVDIFWFAAETGALYAVILMLEVCFIVSVIRSGGEVSKA